MFLLGGVFESHETQILPAALPGQPTVQPPCENFPPSLGHRSTMFSFIEMVSLQRIHPKGTGCGRHVSIRESILQAWKYWDIALIPSGGLLIAPPEKFKQAFLGFNCQNRKTGWSSTNVNGGSVYCLLIFEYHFSNTLDHNTHTHLISHEDGIQCFHILLRYKGITVTIYSLP